MKKRLFSALLGVLLLFQAAPVNAESAVEDPVESVDEPVEQETQEEEVIVEVDEPETSAEEELVIIDEPIELVEEEKPEETVQIEVEESSDEKRYVYELPTQEGYSDGGMFYPGEPDDSELVITEIDDYMEVSDTVVYHTTPEDAGMELAAQMANRSANPTVYVDFSKATYSSWTAVARAVIAAAFIPNGIPNQGDYLANQYYSWTCKMYPVSGGNGYKGKIVYEITYLSSAEQEAEMATAIEDLLDDLGVWGMDSDLDKFTVVYTWLTSNVTYDHEHLNDSSYLRKHTAYAALIDRTAVCQGYATLLYRLCLRMGIDCRYISGGGHAWNLVCIDGLYYYCDATWDAQIHPESYSYYLVARPNFTNHTVSSTYTSSDFIARYPSGTENLTYPENQRMSAQGIRWREGTPDVFALDGGTIRVVAEVYPWEAYSGTVDYRMSRNEVGQNGGYILGNSSEYGNYIGVNPVKTGTFTVVANGGGYQLTKTFSVVEELPETHTTRVNFVDIHPTKPQDLSAYTLSYELTPGETLSLTEDIFQPLADAHYITNQTWPIEISYGDDDVTIKVDHGGRANSYLTPTPYTRTIKFVDEEGNELSPSVVQTIAHIVTGGSSLDLVTDESNSWYDEYWDNNIDYFEAVDVPEIDGFIPETGRIERFTVSDLTINEYEEIVTYLKPEDPPIYAALMIETDSPVDILSGIQPTSEDKYFLGWSDGENFYPAYRKFTVSSPTTLTAQFGDEPATGAIDVNARIDGQYVGSTAAVATFDVLINGELVKTNVTDFYKRYPAGTTFEITNINTLPGYTFTGVNTLRSYNGCTPAESLFGKIGADGITDVALTFISDDYTGTAGNVAKANNRPVIDNMLTEGESVNYVIGTPASGQIFNGWNHIDGTYTYEASWSDPVYLDVNMRLDGKYKGSTESITTFDVYINDELNAHNVTDYYRKWPVGTKYEVKMNDASNGYEFLGVYDRPSSSAYVYGGGMTGYIQDSRTECWLMFKSKSVAVDVNAMINSRYKGSTTGVATFDVYANGHLEKANATDFYKRYPVGTEIEIKNIQITDDNYVFNGTSPKVSYNGCVHQNNVIFTTVDGGVNDVVLAFDEAPKVEAYVDINARVNGVYRGHTSGVATFDVYANGQLVKSNATDFYKKFPVGTLIEIRNINVADGYAYIGTSDKPSYGNVHHQNDLSFYVETELVNDVALRFVDSSSVE